MTPFETFFTLSFASTIAVALLATGYRYMTALTALYRVVVYQWKQPLPPKYDVDNLKFSL